MSDISCRDINERTCRGFGLNEYYGKDQDEMTFEKKCVKQQKKKDVQVVYSYILKINVDLNPKILFEIK